MKVKVVLHIDWDEKKRLVMALNNISNLLKAVRAEEASICLVANGQAVNLLKKDRAKDHAERIKQLADAGVRFLVCNNSLINEGIQKEDLIESCEPVPAGILELIRLQEMGFAYIKP